MLAEASTSRAILPALTVGTVIKGRASASASKSRINSCKNKSRLRRNRCQGVLASVSWMTCRQRKVLEIITSRRRNRSIYSSRMGTAAASPAKAAGVRNDIA